RIAGQPPGKKRELHRRQQVVAGREVEEVHDAPDQAHANRAERDDTAEHEAAAEGLEDDLDSHRGPASPVIAPAPRYARRTASLASSSCPRPSMRVCPSSST